jgi:16S rRNA U516 pseudouridylate synthase RsuA-like enzyme
MDEDKLNMEIRKFLKEVGVTSQREIERVLREGQAKGSTLHLKMSLTSKNVASLEHVVEHEIQLS